MPDYTGSTVIVGAQWGDEGKGKVSNALSQFIEVAVRPGGGANAGHTFYDESGRKIVRKLLPCGGRMQIVGPAVIVDEVILDEVKEAVSQNIQVFIDPDCMVSSPLEKQTDNAREAMSGAGRIGTTGRGIGPSHENRSARFGLRLKDLLSREALALALDARGYLRQKSAVLKKAGLEPCSFDRLICWADQFQALQPHLADTRALVAKLTHQNARIMYENSQGVLLDAVHGNWPFCTSAVCTSAGPSVSLGVYQFDRVIGIAKAYCTRVGEGPMPTELFEQEAEEMRRHGDEFGSVTNRPRRPGWLDIPALNYACRIGGINQLIITKLDILTGYNEIPVCVSYGNDVKRFTTLTREVMEQAHPEYATLKGWNEPIENIRSLNDLPRNARAYIDFIDKSVPSPVIGVSVGPRRDQMIWMD